VYQISGQSNNVFAFTDNFCCLMERRKTTTKKERRKKQRIRLTVDCTIRVSRDLGFLHLVGIHITGFELDSSTPLEYISMLSNPTRHQFSDRSS